MKGRWWPIVAIVGCFFAQFVRYCSVLNSDCNFIWDLEGHSDRWNEGGRVDGLGGVLFLVVVFL